MLNFPLRNRYKQILRSFRIVRAVLASHTYYKNTAFKKNLCAILVNTKSTSEKMKNFGHYSYAFYFQTILFERTFKTESYTKTTLPFKVAGTFRISYCN